MAHRLKRDPETIAKARTILSAPDLLGRLAYSAPDEGIVRAAEAHLNTMEGCGAALSLELRRLGDTIRAQMPARLHRLFGIEDRPLTDLERLAELKQ